MAVEVKLKLPEALVEHARLFGQATQRDIDEVLVDTLELMWSTIVWSASGPPVAALSDDDILVLADSKMDAVQNERLAELQTRGKTDHLTAVERAELLSLLHIYQIGQLRKAESLAEAVRRGLRPPLSSLN